MLITKAYKFRIYPNNEHREALVHQFGQARFVYNRYLTIRKEYYFENGQSLSRYDTQKMLKELKQTEGFEWLKMGDSQVLQYALKNLDTAYQNFFKMVKTGTLPAGNGKPRKDGMPKGYPSYHSKYDEQSITYPQRFKVNGSRVYLPKVGWVRTIFHRYPAGKMKNCTVSKTKSGRYFIAIQCELEVDDPVFRGNQIGIDLGLIDFITPSEGEPVPAPNYLRKSEEKIKRLQRKLSRRDKGSKGREKARIAVARQHEKIANQRRDFQHKLSRELVEQNRLIGFENLNIRGMLKNHHLAKSISDASWSEFVRQCEYKGQWYGCNIEKVGRFFPSSKLCHICGDKHQSLKLSARKWFCTGCETIHNREKNAAINILNEVTVGDTEINAGGVQPIRATLKPEAQRL